MLRPLVLAAVAATLALPARAAERAGEREDVRVRDGWYLGVGLGLADGATHAGGVRRTFGELVGDDPTRLALQVEAGVTVTPRLLLGVDLSFAGAGRDGADPVLGSVKRGVSVANLDLVATVFPFVEGFHLRAGAGLSQIALLVESDAGRSEQRHGGVNVLGGLGWAFWIGQTFNLCLNLDLSRQWYRSSEPGAPASSSFAIAYAGFDWY
jgi:hypothetical protein